MGIAALAVVCLVMVCQVKSCAKRLSSASHVADGLQGTLSLLSPTNITQQSEPQKPSIVPPGHSAHPSASRRPVFGVPSDEGTQVEVKVKVKSGEDSIRIQVGKNGIVRNVGKDTVAIRVTRYGPPWIEWDPSVGACGFLSESRTELWPVAKWRGCVVDVGAKVKLIDFRPGRTVQIGVPVVYVTTAGPGVGCDFRISGMEWIALDAGWFPMVKRAAVGISINIP